MDQLQQENEAFSQENVSQENQHEGGGREKAQEANKLNLMSPSANEVVVEKEIQTKGTSDEEVKQAIQEWMADR